MFARGQTALILMLTALVPALMAADEARPQAVRVDHYGDPLPPGAIARLGTLRLRHQGNIASMDFSPDGKVLASAGELRTFLRLWDTATGKEIRRISGLPGDNLEVVKYSPTGRMIAGGGSHDYKPNIILLWDAATGKLLHRVEGHYWRDIAFLDERTLVSVDDEGQVRWWNLPSGKKARQWHAMGVVEKPKDAGTWKFAGISSASLSRNGRTLAAIVHWKENANNGGDGKSHNHLTIWDLDQRKKRWQLAKGKDDFFASFDLSADGKILAIAGSTGVSIRDGVTGRELRHIKDPEEGSPFKWEILALSRDGKRMAILDPWTIGFRVWDTPSGKILHRHPHCIVHGPRLSEQRLIFAPDGKVLAFSFEGTLVLWDVASSVERPLLQGHREPVVFLSFSPDGKTLYSGGDSSSSFWLYPSTSRTWDTATWRETARSDDSEYQEFSVPPLFVSHDHRLGVVHDAEGDFFVTERASGKKLRQLAYRSKEIAPPEYGGFFSPSGKTVVQSIPKPGAKPSKYDLALLDMASGRLWGRLPAKTREIFLAFAPDDRFVAWIDERAVIHIVAMDGGKELRRLGRAREKWDYRDTALNLTFSPDGRHLAFWDGEVKDVVIWDWRTGKEHCRLPGRRNALPTEVCLAYSPDGRCLAVGGIVSKQDVELWELASGQLRRRIPGHQDYISSLAFAPDGRLLASGSDDTTVLVWDLYGLSLRDKPAQATTAEGLQSLWADLSRQDARRANDAITALVQIPQQTISLFSQQLRPVSAPDAGKVARAVADLESKEFAMRANAARELEEFAELAEPALRKALTGKPSLEARRRIESLLDKLDHLPPERLRQVRAVEVLELLGTPEARELLRRLAGGAPEARLTQEAKSSLERLLRRPAVR